VEPVHLASPMSFSAKGVAKTVVQGSSEEITSCVLNTVLCEEGFREDLPEFGVPSLLFQTVPLQLAPFEAAIKRWEPRAELTLEELENLIPADRTVVVNIS
jgi:phage baseplate assembly protein W